MYLSIYHPDENLRLRELSVEKESAAVTIYIMIVHPEAWADAFEESLITYGWCGGSLTVSSHTIFVSLPHYWRNDLGCQSSSRADKFSEAPEAWDEGSIQDPRFIHLDFRHLMYVYPGSTILCLWWEDCGVEMLMDFGRGIQTSIIAVSAPFQTLKIVIEAGTFP